MADLHVDVPRVLERDQLLAALKEHGYEARATEDDGWPAIEIPCGGDAGSACDDLVAELERLVGDLDAPLIPVRGDGVVYLRPPAS